MQLLCMSGLACHSYQVLTSSKPHHHTSLQPSDSQQRFIRSYRACCKRIQLESSLLPLSFMPTLESDNNRSLSLSQPWPWTVDPCEIFECAHFKFTVSGWSKQASKQTNIHTHVRNEVTLVWGSLRLAPITARAHKNGQSV